MQSQALLGEQSIEQKTEAHILIPTRDIETTCNLTIDTKQRRLVLQVLDPMTIDITLLRLRIMTTGRDGTGTGREREIEIEIESNSGKELGIPLGRESNMADHPHLLDLHLLHTVVACLEAGLVPLLPLLLGEKDGLQGQALLVVLGKEIDKIGIVIATARGQSIGKVEMVQRPVWTHISAEYQSELTDYSLLHSMLTLLIVYLALDRPCCEKQEINHGQEQSGQIMLV